MSLKVENLEKRIMIKQNAPKQNVWYRSRSGLQRHLNSILKFNFKLSEIIKFYWKVYLRWNSL